MNDQLVSFTDDAISGYCPEFSETRTITVTYEIDSIKGKPGFTKWRYKEFDCDDKQNCSRSRNCHVFESTN